MSNKSAPEPRQASARFCYMTDDDIVHDAFNIAWSVLKRSGELRDLDRSSKVLKFTIMEMVAGGERRRLFLVDRALKTYRDVRDQLRLAS